ncbi:MAG: serine/threonine protein kinase [Phycisphaerales bacterium]|jgi:serine/threonine protein kinase|nr:serine/threonine protein kinase [Phycisphaerales bacterium]
MSESDQALLDEAFDRALSSWEDGAPISPDKLFPDRPDLSDHADRLLALARDVAVMGAPTDPSPAVPGYTILSELGSGAMGAVYLARQERLGGRSVALKVLPAGAAVSARARDRFQAEANAIARLRHPHVVTVHDVVREGGVIAFAMELVDGASLHDVIDHLSSIGTPPRTEDVRAYLGSGASVLGEIPYWMLVARLGVAIARALEAVHGAGLLHRDVKPANILLRRDCTPLLSDFGLVRDPESGVATRAEGFVGTPAYASPEQLAGGIGATDAKSDIYSLGATLFHALALRPPFAGRSPGEVTAAIERGAVPVRTLAPGVPRDLETIVQKAMSPRREDRYASAAAMADDLDRLLAERPILARRPGLLSRGVKLLRRNRQAFRGSIIGALVALLLVGAATFGLVIAPRWAQGARERAWLALLDPRDTSTFANAGFFEYRFPGPPKVSRDVVSRALAEYGKALRFQPWDDRTLLERDALAAMLSLDASGRGPIRFSEELLRRAPRACAWLRAWSQIPADSPPPPLPPDLLASDELIALGMMSYATSEMLPAVEAWQELEHHGEPGAFVRAGLGLYFIYSQQHGRAYPRLEDADRAFRGVSFLRAAHAEAAWGVGDTELAGTLLDQARGLESRDEAQLMRVGILVDLACGNVDDGLKRFEAWYFAPRIGGSSVAGFQVGAWFEARGENLKALCVYSNSINNESPNRCIRRFIPLAEHWWSGLSERERLAFLEHAISSKVRIKPWELSRVPVSYSGLHSFAGIGRLPADVAGLLHDTEFARVGSRLYSYFETGNPGEPGVPEPPTGEALHRAAREVLGLAK